MRWFHEFLKSQFMTNAVERTVSSCKYLDLYLSLHKTMKLYVQLVALGLLKHKTGRGKPIKADFFKLEEDFNVSCSRDLETLVVFKDNAKGSPGRFHTQ